MVIVYTSTTEKCVIDVVSLLPRGSVCWIVVVHLLIEPELGARELLKFVVGLKFGIFVYNKFHMQMCILRNSADFDGKMGIHFKDR